jgi:hypothetical protein
VEGHLHQEPEDHTEQGFAHPWAARKHMVGPAGIYERETKIPVTKCQTNLAFDN